MKDLIDAARHWCFEVALPLWATAGRDDSGGGVFEALDFAGRPVDTAYRRTRVMGRQLYVFSHASLLGWAPGRAAADHVYRFLVNKAWLGPERGWARRVTATGAPLDPTPDLYDYAFVLFGLSWYARASGDPGVWVHVERTLDALEGLLSHPGGAGFWHEVPPVGPRQQNPHMHLLEAALAALATHEGPHPRLLALGRHLVDVFRTHLFDRHSATLGEFFSDDWSRLPGPEGEVVEPGHMFEWAWILAQAEAPLGLSLGHEIAALIDNAEAHGVDRATGRTLLQMTRAGQPLDAGTRTWPNTERIKGWLGASEALGRDPRAAVGQSLRCLFATHLATAVPGLWIDAFDADGQAQSANAPASSLYHLFLAFAEVLRLEARLTGGAGD
jgi:mannose/cellobiose epimerase-like protein (N-acyl-D-glucosamine 2-epimerase family)